MLGWTELEHFILKFQTPIKIFSLLLAPIYQTLCFTTYSSPSPRKVGWGVSQGGAGGVAHSGGGHGMGGAEWWCRGTEQEWGDKIKYAKVRFPQEGGNEYLQGYWYTDAYDRPLSKQHGSTGLWDWMPKRKHPHIAFDSCSWAKSIRTKYRLLKYITKILSKFCSWTIIIFGMPIKSGQE